MADDLPPPATAAQQFTTPASPAATEERCLRRQDTKRRRSIQQKDEEGCCTSSMAATADDNLQPINKRFKAESPGEARSKDSTPVENELARYQPASDGTNYWDRMPDELVLKVFSFLYEYDIATLSAVSRRFYAVSNDLNLWRTLYQQAFEYTVPLFHLDNGKFEFRDVKRCRDHNPWKESFRQLRFGVHVRPRKNHIYEGLKGRNLKQFDRLEQALIFLEAEPTREKLIFLHSGTYFPEPIIIKSPVQIIGAAAGSPGTEINRNVIIENTEDTTICFMEGSAGAYVGYTTLRFNPEKKSGAPGGPQHQTHYALCITDATTVTVDRCRINSTSDVGAALCVKKGAEPKVRHCSVTDCENVGIYITDNASGHFEDCEIARNCLAGVWVKNHANPFFKKCHIHHGKDVGIFTFEYGMGYFEKCNIHSNRISGIEVKNHANPTVLR
ncbi:hypothetical protein WR25_16167, partial [Diploscapter pachys]